MSPADNSEGKEEKMHRITDLPVRHRYVFLALMTSLTVLCGALIPKININTDMTQYLPSDSRMREGIDTLKATFPAIDMNAFTVNVMLPKYGVLSYDKADAADFLSGFEGIEGVTSIRENDRYLLYSLSVEKGSDAGKVEDKIRDSLEIIYSAAMESSPAGTGAEGPDTGIHNAEGPGAGVHGTENCNSENCSAEDCSTGDCSTGVHSTENCSAENSEAENSSAEDSSAKDSSAEFVVESNANSIMPDNMVLILIIAVILVFGILFLMCSSFVEALLFILTIGMAVVINMGTNALLPSVSMMTNTIVAVLQLVLSMDYSIILMNRYRQELAVTSDKVEAMKKALWKASPSILSSSFTTIVGLFMLIFMKFKIGLDLGIVLSKGVFCSLVSIYTILPALVLIFDKAIKATEKRIFLIPTDSLARFETRFRIPLAILFVTVFFGSYYLHNRTELSFASIWESRIAEEFHPQNTFMLLYRTEDEENIPSLIDSLSNDEKVSVAISYPSIFLKRHKVADMADCIRELSAMHPAGEDFKLDSTLLSEEMLRILYYACTNPERNEKMNFSDIATLAEEIANSDLIPESMDINSMISSYMSQFIPSSGLPADSSDIDSCGTAFGPTQERPGAMTGTTGTASAPEPTGATGNYAANRADTGDGGGLIEKETVPAPGDTVAGYYTEDTDILAPGQKSTDKKNIPEGLSAIPVDSAGRFTLNNSTVQLDSKQMASFLGFDPAMARAVYKISGMKLMSAYSFVHFVSEKILSKKLYSRIISKEQIDGLQAIKDSIDCAVKGNRSDEQPMLERDSDGIPAHSAIASGFGNKDGFSVKDDANAVPEGKSKLISEATATGDRAATVSAKADSTTATAGTGESPLPAIRTDIPAEETNAEDDAESLGNGNESSPIDILTEMAFSDRKYSSCEISSALTKAGINIDPELINLLFLYYGSRKYFDSSVEMSLDDMLQFLSGEFLDNKSFAAILDDNSKSMIQGLDALVDEGLGALRKERFSMAAIVTDYDIESAETYNFIERLQQLCNEKTGGDHYLIGESVMYKEMKDGFGKELIFLTILTVLAIFSIVALTFRSLAVPTITVMTVLSGVYINVFVSGIGGHTMLYLAYLIVQNILMGATIDYGILFTNYYLENRKTRDVGDSLREAYRGSIHTIMTSGLIIICAPYIMSVLLTDPTITSILSSLTFGALAAITLILFVLPAVIACLDKPLTRRLRKQSPSQR